MTQEEKAKAYDEAFEYAHYLINERCKEGTDGSFHRVDLEKIFPELEESEDERIRKRLINYFHGFLDGYEDTYKVGGCVKWEGLDVKDVIAWLEKQGEQNLDTDFSDLRTWKYIVDAVLTEREGIGQYIDSPFTEEVAKKLQKRFGNIEQKPTISDEALREGIIKFGLTQYQIDNWLKKHINVVEQKSAWSEEDEFELENVLCHLINYLHKDSYIRYENWLKSLKNRVQPKPKWKPSDEQMKVLDWSLHNWIGNTKEILESLYNDLKKLKGE